MKANLNNIRVIKWYQYDCEGLQKQIYEAKMKRYNQKLEDEAAESAEQVFSTEQSDSIDAVAATDNTSNDVDLDAEVARIMAAFTGAKQDGVDSVFQSMCCN